MEVIFVKCADIFQATVLTFWFSGYAGISPMKDQPVMGQMDQFFGNMPHKLFLSSQWRFSIGG